MLRTVNCARTELLENFGVLKLGSSKKSLENVDKMSSFCDPLTSICGVCKDSVTMSGKILQSRLQNMSVIEIVGAIQIHRADYLNEV